MPAIPAHVHVPQTYVYYMCYETYYTTYEAHNHKYMCVHVHDTVGKLLLTITIAALHTHKQ